MQHIRVYGSIEKPVSKTRIAPQSKKRKQLQSEYVKLVKQMLQENKYCEIKAPGCTKLAQGLHHIVKRSATNLMDRKILKRSCNHCNLYIEEHPAWATQNGFSKSKYSKHE